MRALISAALRLRWVVAILSLLLLVWGFQLIRTTPLDVFPEFSPLLVEIQTEAPGLSTAEVESLVSSPIENALNGVKGLKTLRSKSVLGLSSVVLIFDAGAELMPSRQLVQERLLTLTGQLPALAKAPVILSPLSSTSRVLKIGVWSKTMTQTEMTTLVRWTVRPRLMAIPGVANVAIWGQRDKQLQVLVDPDRLRDHNLTLSEIIKATQDATMPAAGGFVETPNQRLSVTHVAAVREAEDLRRVPVAFRNGTPLELGKVTQVVEGHQPPIGDAIINDGPGLLLIVEKQLGANTLEVTRNVEKVVDQLRPGLQGLELDTTIFRPATFIEMSLDNLRDALLWGCLLVAVILIAFLFEWRTAFISMTAIPLSLMTAALFLHWRGTTLNVMVIAGLAIALGEVVDDAIIDVENVLRRLRQNELAGHPQPAWKVVLEASLEVRSAVVFATVIVILVFMPVFFLDGLAGAFFRPLALSYVLAVTASLAVALIVTPALALILLPRASTADHKEPPLTRLLKSLYARMLPPLLDRPMMLAGAVAVIFVITGFSVTRLGEEFLPHFKEYDFLMHWVEKPGTSLEAMNRITARASVELRAIPGVRNFGSHIGRAEVADEVVGPNFTELWISLDPKVPYKPTVAKIQEAVDGYPGLYRDLLTYLKERIKEVLSGGSGAIVVRLFGPNLGELRSKAAEIGAAMATVPGVTNLQVEAQVEVPQIEIKLKPEAALRFGLTAADVRRAAMTMIRGTKVGEVYDDQKIFDVTVWGEEKLRKDISSLGKILIDAPGGAKIPLEDVAELRIAPTPNVIQHENASRRIDVSCNVKSGSDLGAVARAIAEKVKAVPMAPGYHPELLGEYAARQASRERLLALSGIALLGILLVLYADFKSPRLMLLVFASLPFALVGGVAAAFWSGGVLSLGSLVGFVTVLGIAARNGVMLVSHYRHLEEQEGMAFGRELILRGSEERLAPILMTACATALALLPIALGGDKPGHEIEHPMAVIILGGLFTSTLLNLFVMPALSMRFAKANKPNL